MFSMKSKTVIGLIGLLSIAILVCHISASQAAPLPDPQFDDQLAVSPTNQSIVLAGGCFWGMQAVFQHLKGVKQAISGYAGDKSDTAHYETVSTGTTGHAESVQVTYDSSQITLGKILKVYFSVEHNLTELNYQGPDHGSQYRSTVFYSSPEQQKIAVAYIAQLNAASAYSTPIVTALEPLKGFYLAEDYHQDYATLHPDNAYIAINDLPKVANLQKQFPDLYVK